MLWIKHACWNCPKISKSVAMLFPKTLEHAKQLEREENTPEDLEFVN
jgi:hypothetical protein